MPRTSRSLSIQRLRTELETGHKRNNGRFTPQAKAELVQCVWKAMFEMENKGTILFDVDDPQATPDMRCPDLEHVLLVDEDGWRQPWSLSKNQKRGELVRRAQGKHWRRVPKGRMCGKTLKRGQRYYTCK